MKVVTLVSGGLDSSLVSCLLHEEGIEQFPLFINYGQLNFQKEFSACVNVLKGIGVPEVEVIDIRNFGEKIKSGITSVDMDTKEEAFLPNRNAIFILLGASYAFRKGCTHIAIGLLDDKYSIFPDQTRHFIAKMQEIINLTLGVEIKIITPLMVFSKKEVVNLAESKGLVGTYSCHEGTDENCGKCIACLEYKF